MSYRPSPDRYSNMVYQTCGDSGLTLPALSFGLWHNFGHDVPNDTKKALCHTAFDNGITTALLGASRPEQIVECVGAVDNLVFTTDNLDEIDHSANEQNLNLRATSSASE